MYMYTYICVCVRVRVIIITTSITTTGISISIISIISITITIIIIITIIILYNLMFEYVYSCCIHTFDVIHGLFWNQVCQCISKNCLRDGQHILLAFSSAERLEKAMDREMVNMMVHIDNLDECMRGSQCKMGRNTPLGLAIIYIYIIPLGNSCIKSRGLSSKNRFILYSGFPLWLGSTGEGCDSIEVSGCQTRAWRSTFYIKASLEA